MDQTNDAAKSVHAEIHPALWMLQQMGAALPKSYVVVQAARVVRSTRIQLRQHRGLTTSVRTDQLATAWHTWLYQALLDHSLAGFNIYARLQAREDEECDALRADAWCTAIGGWLPCRTREFIPYQREQQLLLYRETGYAPSIAVRSEQAYGYLWLLTKPIPLEEGMRLQRATLRMIQGECFSSKLLNHTLDAMFPLPGFLLTSALDAPREMCGLVHPEQGFPVAIPAEKLRTIPPSRVQDIKSYFGGMVYVGDAVERAKEIALAASRRMRAQAARGDIDGAVGAIVARAVRVKACSGRPTLDICPDFNHKMWRSIACVVPLILRGYDALTVGERDELEIYFQQPLDETAAWSRTLSKLLYLGYTWKAVEELLTRPGIARTRSLSWYQHEYELVLMRARGVSKDSFSATVVLDILRQIQTVKGEARAELIRRQDRVRTRVYDVREDVLAINLIAAADVLRMGGALITDHEVREGVRRLRGHPIFLQYVKRKRIWLFDLELLRAEKIWLDASKA